MMRALQTDVADDVSGPAPDVSGSFRTVDREASLLRTGRLQTAVFNSIYFFSITTDEKGLIQIFNVGAERMFGYPAVEVLNRLTPFDLSDRVEAGARAQALSREIGVAIRPGFKSLVFKASLGVEDMYEWACVRKDGSRLPALVSVTALRDAVDGIIGYLLIGTDNSARKRLEAAHDSGAAQGHAIHSDHANIETPGIRPAEADFLSRMAQQLRGPLESVNRLSGLLAAESASATPVDHADIGRMLHAGRALLDLVGEIIDLGMIESGKLELHDQPVSLAELLREAETATEPEARLHEVRLAVPLFDDALLVRADRVRLKQVLIHLLSNAIRYNRPNGSVVVEYSIPAPGRICVSVRDTGAGLAPDQLARLFEPYHRLAHEASAHHGVGIGLALCRRLVELMGGTIGAESSAGAGCLFWIELGAAGALVEAPPRAESVPTPHTLQPGAAATRTLLYVEDDPVNMLLVERLIARRPEIRLLTAVDGTVAIDVARNDEPDVILMDINLPGISGIQTLEMLQQDPLTALIPVVALSANAMPNDITKGMDAGFFRYLTKPLRLDLFTAALDEAFDAASTRRRQASGHDQRV
jgi:signal transduction histidine kinase/ActR/RegA family two-component response regulator